MIRLSKLRIEFRRLGVVATAYRAGATSGSLVHKRVLAVNGSKQAITDACGQALAGTKHALTAEQVRTILTNEPRVGGS